MGPYLLKRLVLVIPTLLAVSLLVALMVRFLPGDVVDTLLDQFRLGGREEEELRERLGLSDPFFEQYGSWLWNMMQGDFGDSLVSNRSIGGEMARRLPVTMELGVLAMLMGAAFAIPIGIISALRQDRWPDYIARTTAILMIAVPGFWVATLVVTLPSIWFSWTPPLEYERFENDPLTNLEQMILPAAVLGLVLSGTVLRMTRATLLEVMTEDYIRTAAAKGLPERTIVVRHALRNALLPVITIIGLQLPILVGGAVIVEIIFGIPGIGRFFLTAIDQRDYPVVQALTFVIAIVVVFSNIVVDFSYRVLDPRVQLN